MFIPRHMEVVRQCVSKFALSGFTRTTELSSALILHWRRQARLEECRVSTIMTEAAPCLKSSSHEKSAHYRSNNPSDGGSMCTESKEQINSCLITMAKLIPNKWFWPPGEGHLVSVVKRCCRYPLLYNSCFIFPLLITCLRKSMLNSQKIAY